MEIITQIQGRCQKTRLGIPIIYGIDAIHGATYTKGCDPISSEHRSRRDPNPEIARQIGEVTAREVRASGIPWNFHPFLTSDDNRSGPGFWETYGEMLSLRQGSGPHTSRGCRETISGPLIRLPHA